MVARGALAKDLEGSNAALGAVTLAFGLTGLVTTPLGGVAADRFPKRRMLMISTCLLFASSVWIAIAVEFNFVSFWMLLAASAIQSAGFSGLLPARMAFTAELVGPNRLSNGIVLSQISMNLNRVIGPVMAGVFLGLPALGIGAVYWVSSAITASSALFFLSLPAGNPQSNPLQRSATVDLLDGIKYGFATWPVPLLLTTSAFALFFGFPYVAFLPSVSADLFSSGNTGYAWLSAMGAVGGLVAALVIAGSAGGNVAWKIHNSSVVGFGVGIAALGAAPSFGVAMGVMFGLGAATAAFQSMNATLTLASSEAAYHGRMQSLLQLGFNFFGIAALPLGICADNFGLRKTLMFMGLVVVIVGIASVSVYRTKVDTQAGPLEQTR
jgi:MFS family permease